MKCKYNPKIECDFDRPKQVRADCRSFGCEPYEKFICQCGSCEEVFKVRDLKDRSCPYCGSGNWIFGYIDE